MPECRRREGSDIWHWCKNCSKWATSTLVVLAAGAVGSLVWTLAEQNRVLKSAVARLGSLNSSRPTLSAGDSVPSIELTDVQGRSQNLAELVHGGAVVAFLTTTCRFCESTLPAWTELSDRLATGGIPFVAVSLDDLEASKDFARSAGISWDLWAPSDPSATWDLGVSVVPLTVIVSSQGDIQEAWRGALSNDDVSRIRERAEEVLTSTGGLQDQRIGVKSRQYMLLALAQLACSSR